MLSRILPSKIAVVVSMAVIFCGLQISSVSAKVYKWVDSDGRTQYSDRPPQDRRLQPTTISIIPVPKRDDVQVELPSGSVVEAIFEPGNQEEKGGSPDEAEAKQKQENIRSALRQRCAEARKELAISISGHSGVSG